MNCKTAQHQMALAVGEDLAPAETEELQNHLQGCSFCLQTWENHRRGFAVLQRSRTSEIYAKNDSVWPALSNRLTDREVAPRRREFNGWIGALAVTTACVLIFVFSQDTSLPIAARSSPNHPVAGNLASSPHQHEKDSSLLRRDEVESDGTYHDESQPVSNRR